jgi:hypothetical protein
MSLQGPECRYKNFLIGKATKTRRSLFLPKIFVCWAERLRRSGPPEQTEETMNLITRFELASRKTSELYALRRTVFNDFARSKPGTLDRSIALASIENLNAEIAARPPVP